MVLAIHHLPLRAPVHAITGSPDSEGVQSLKSYKKSEAGTGMGLVVFIIALAVIFLLLAVKVLSRQGPEIVINTPPKGLGLRSQLIIEARDMKHNVKALEIDVIQGGQVVYRAAKPVSERPLQWWKFSGHVSTATWTVPLGRNEISGLKEGRATVRVMATNDSWGRFFRGGRSEKVWVDLPVRFAPPQVGVLTTQH